MIRKITTPTSRQCRARASIGGLALLSSLAATGCSGAKPSSDAGAPSTAREQVLDAAGQCALQNAQRFMQASANLSTELHAVDSTAQSRQQQFVTAMAAWQRNEAWQLGPAAASTSPGGRDLRDHIYAWPFFDRCAIDTHLVRGTYQPNTAALPINVRGLGTLEYLLHFTGTDTGCAADAAIVTDGSWAALSATELQQRRTAYAVAVADDVKQRAQQLVTAWETFAPTLRTPGAGNRVFSSTHVALNTVSDALFYLDHEAKDLKLARTIGLRDCAAAPCLNWLESPWAPLNTSHLQQNLDGFRELMEGCGADFSGTGFDDLLREVGAGGVADRLHEKLVAVQQKLDALQGKELAEVLRDDPAAARALYDGIKEVTDLLKSEFLSVLDLEIPRALEGDND